MYATIYSVSNNDESARCASPLLVAQEYENVFGRLALDDLLLDTIPDDEYSPGLLHRLLLDLPWADVFTTNYDTLLERTLKGELRQKYNTVFSIEDLAGRSQPRIVKLHGSFPSQRPFIITEEDYRTYPQEFAPFVNTVQQSLMENVFCLIGFSGDDPNSKQWLGWVHSNLGRWAPKVHLVGVFDYSPQKIVSLDKSGVIAIDLAPLFPTTDYPNQSVRHYSALEWFLRSLYRPTPTILSNWPDVISSLYSSIVAHSPQRYPPLVDADYPEPLEHVLSQQSEQLEVPLQIAHYWEALRHLYPGWVVSPKHSRTHLLVDLSKRLQGILDSISTLTAPERLVVLHEVVWREERLLIHLDSKHAALIEDVLRNVNPRPDLLELESNAIAPSPANDVNLDWRVLEEKWFNLGLSLIRMHRGEFERSKFEEWFSCLSKLAGEDPSRGSRLSNELTLFHLASLREREVRKALVGWKSTPEIPFSEVRRASVFAELGDFREAYAVVSQALEDLRYDDSESGDNLGRLSQEGSALWLSHVLGFQLRIESSETATSQENEDGSRKRESDNRRWEKIGRLGCDPWDIAEKIGEELTCGESITVETKKLFDIDEYRTTVHHRTVECEASALSFLRAIEDAAVPLRCGMNAQFGKKIAVAARLLGEKDPVRALSILARSGQRKAIEDVFSRPRMRAFSDRVIQRLFEVANSALDEALKLADEQEYSSNSRIERTMRYRVATACGQVLSRLVARLSPSERKSVLDIACRAFRSPLFRSSIEAHEHLGDLFRRVLSQATGEELSTYLEGLYGLPILDSAPGFEVSYSNRWPEPTIWLGWSSSGGASSKYSPDPKMVEELIRVVYDGSAIARPIAASRLDALDRFGFLGEEDSQRFGVAIWSRTDEGNGLPADLDYQLHAFLRLPGARENEADDILRHLLLTCELHPAAERIVFPEGVPFERERKVANYNQFHDVISLLVNASQYPGGSDPQDDSIEWTSSEAIQHLNRIAAWIDKNADDLREFASLFINKQQIKGLLTDTADAVGFLLLPLIEGGQYSVKKTAGIILDFCGEFDCPALELLPGLVLHAPEEADRACRSLLNGILSRDQHTANSAHRALWRWIVLSQEYENQQFPRKLVGAVVGVVTYRCTRNRRYSMEVVNSILKHYPGILAKAEVDDLIDALSFLLDELRLSRNMDRQEACVDAPGLPAESNDEYKRECVAMAYRLYCVTDERTAAQSRVLENWREEAEKEMVKEVRDAWPDVLETENGK